MKSPTMLNRRVFLTTAGALAANSWLPGRLLAAGLPEISNPRATSGDSVEPDWTERLTVTVGPEKADLVGNSDKVIQAAVDYASRLGGGTVHILPGLYRLRNAVHLSSNIRILGSGADSILTKNDMVKTELAADSDWFDQEITLEDAAGFEVGDGIALQTTDPRYKKKEVLKRILVARSGNRFKLDRPLRKNFWTMGDSTAANLFPLLNGENIEDVVIENIALDGNRENNDNFNGNYGGCIFLQDCNRVAARRVEARNYDGDGISWQVCHDVVIEDCHSHGNVGLGLHPGSGSQRPLIRNNRLEGNNIGIFFCWGVRHGLAQDNRILQNKSYGISIGHRDTDNLIRENEIIESGKAGVLFRPERGKAFAPHRNRIERNRIVDSGPEDGIGIDVQGEVESITLDTNDIQETRAPKKRIGVRIGEGTRKIELIDNRIRGFSVPVVDGQGGAGS